MSVGVLIVDKESRSEECFYNLSQPKYITHAMSSRERGEPVAATI
jgi:hypothetical protein